jgi:hypothetical protein
MGFKFHIDDAEASMFLVLLLLVRQYRASEAEILFFASVMINQISILTQRAVAAAVCAIEQ